MVNPPAMASLEHSHNQGAIGFSAMQLEKIYQEQTGSIQALCSVPIQTYEVMCLVKFGM